MSVRAVRSAVTGVVPLSALMLAFGNLQSMLFQHPMVSVLIVKKIHMDLRSCSYVYSTVCKIGYLCIGCAGLCVQENVRIEYLGVSVNTCVLYAMVWLLS